MLTLPNLLTFFRIFISPIFLLLYVERETLGVSMTILPYLLLFLLIVTELSDTLDGYMARKYDQVSELGKVLDPMADTLSHLSMFFAFTQPPVNLPMLLVFAFLYRDLVISTLRTICALRGFNLAARSSGKLKAILQAVAAFSIVALMIPYSLGRISEALLHYCSMGITMVVGLYALYSGAEYIFANRDYLKKIIAVRTNGRRKSSLMP